MVTIRGRHLLKACAFHQFAMLDSMHTIALTATNPSPVLLDPPLPLVHSPCSMCIEAAEPWRVKMDKGQDVVVVRVQTAKHRSQ